MITRDWTVSRWRNALGMLPLFLNACSADPGVAGDVAMVSYSLTNDAAREAVVEECAGTYANSGQCNVCVSHALNALQMAGSITGAQKGALEREFATGPCQMRCIPTTCNSLGSQCGQPANGCGGTLDCGSCPPGDVCVGPDRVCIPIS